MLSDPSAPPFGEKWLERWLERHPQYRIRRCKSLQVERKRAHDVILIREWFARLQAAIDSSGVYTNREYITAVEAVSADGFTTPPLIIFSAQQIQYRWFHDLNLERIAVTYYTANPPPRQTRHPTHLILYP